MWTIHVDSFGEERIVSTVCLFTKCAIPLSLQIYVDYLCVQIIWVFSSLFLKSIIETVLNATLIEDKPSHAFAITTTSFNKDTLQYCLRTIILTANDK